MDDVGGKTELKMQATQLRWEDDTNKTKNIVFFLTFACVFYV